MTYSSSTLYKDSKGEWRWRVIAENGNVLAVSSEGYKNRVDALLAMKATGMLITAAIKSEQV